MTFENMVKCCDRLTPTEYKLAQFIIKNKRLIQKLSIQELANRTFVSKSGIHRFCKKLGFDGYNGLKLKLIQDLSLGTKDKSIDANFPFLETDNHAMVAKRLLDLYEATVRDTFHSIDVDMLERCVNLLHVADVIDIYTYAHNLNIAENFQDKMRTIGRVVNCPKSFYEQRYTAAASNSKHVAMLLSYSGRAVFLPDIIEMLSRNKVEMILVGRIGNTTSNGAIKNRLYLSDREDFKNRISHFSSHIAMQYMLDVLFSSIFKKDYRKNINYIDEILSIVDDRHLEEE